MKKIKSVKFNSYILTKEFHKWEFEDEISLSEEFIRVNAHLFEIEYEDENFEMEIPKLGVLKNGYYITNYSYYACRNYALEHLSEAYKTGCWFATEGQTVKELELRKTKMFVNKLIEWCDAQCAVEKFCLIEYVNISNYFSVHYSMNKYFNQLIFNSTESAMLFIKQINLPKNETHRSNLIQILKSGKL